MRHAQGLDGVSMLLCTASLFALFVGLQVAAHWAFGGALGLMLISLGFGLHEIYLSARAIRIELESLADERIHT